MGRYPGPIGAGSTLQCSGDMEPAGRTGPIIAGISTARVLRRNQGPLRSASRNEQQFYISGTSCGMDVVEMMAWNQAYKAVVNVCVYREGEVIHGQTHHTTRRGSIRINHQKWSQRQSQILRLSSLLSR